MQRQWMFMLVAVMGLSLFGCQTQKEEEPEPMPNYLRAQSAQAMDLVRDARRVEARGDYDEALGMYGEAAALSPDLVAAHVGLGNMYRKIGNDALALQSYQQAIELDRRAAAAYAGVADIREREGMDREAVTQYLRAVTFKSDEPDWNISLASLYMKLGSPPESLIFARRAVDQDPKNQEAQLVLAHALLEAGRAEASLEAYETAAGLGVLSKEDELRMVRAMLAVSNYDQAHEKLQEIDRTRNHSVAQKLLGESYLQRKEYDNAIEAFDRAQHLDPQLVDAHNGKATALMAKFMESGETDGTSLNGAIEAWETSLSINPDQREVRRRLSAARAMQARE